MLLGIFIVKGGTWQAPFHLPIFILLYHARRRTARKHKTYFDNLPLDIASITDTDRPRPRAKSLDFVESPYDIQYTLRGYKAESIVQSGPKNSIDRVEYKAIDENELTAV